MASLSRRDVEHVAHLARLGLTDDEITLLQGQLNHILEQYAKLAELDTEAIPPTAQTIELENILREDVVTPRCPVVITSIVTWSPRATWRRSAPPQPSSMSSGCAPIASTFTVLEPFVGGRGAHSTRLPRAREQRPRQPC